jgi:hypothetical protein
MLRSDIESTDVSSDERQAVYDTLRAYRSAKAGIFDELKITRKCSWS